MGRRERTVDPAAGPVQAFAYELREMRRAVGSPSYRELAGRAHFSSTSLSVAASGTRMPSLEVTLGYVRACGGDVQEWEQRWRKASGQANRDDGADGGPVPGTVTFTAPASQSPQTAAVPDRASRCLPGPFGRIGGSLRLQGIAALAIIGLIAFAAVGFTATQGGGKPGSGQRPPTAQAVAATGSRSPNGTPLSDGLDPKQAGCDRDAIDLDSHAFSLAAPVTVNGHHLRAGAVIGYISLRYSPACRAAWARLDPAPDIDTPRAGTVDLYTLRPTDGSRTAFHLGHLEEAYDDMLLTGTGCVQAGGAINLAAGPVTTALSSCLTGPPRSSTSSP